MLTYIKNHKVYSFVAAILMCIVYVFTLSVFAYASDDEKEDKGYYDSSSIECGPVSSIQNDEALSPTSEINIYIDPATGKINIKEDINLLNISENKLVKIKEIALKPYIANVDIDRWLLCVASDKQTIFDGNCGDTKNTNIDIYPNSGLKNYCKKATLLVSTTLSVDKAAKFANTTPSFFEFGYDTYTKSPKAVFSNGVLRFYYDYETHKEEGSVFNIDDYGNRSWSSVCGSVNTVEFDKSFYDYKPKTCKEWFRDFRNCINVNKLENLNMQDVEDAQWMFGDCTKLKNIDTSNLLSKGNKIKNLTFMFKTCSNLENLNVAYWDVSKAEYLAGTFAECSLLKQLDVSKWNTESCISFDALFCGCCSLTSIPCENFCTSRAIRLNWVFYNCNNLINLDLSKWNTANCEKLYDIFAYCWKLQTIKGIDIWDTSKVDDMGGVFYECFLLKDINIVSWNTSNVKSFSDNLGIGTYRGMFMYCTSLTTIKASSSFVTYNAIYSTYMFFGSTNIVGGRGTRYNINIIDKTYARLDTPFQAGYFTDANNKNDQNIDTYKDSSFLNDSQDNLSTHTNLDSSSVVAASTATTDCNLFSLNDIDKKPKKEEQTDNAKLPKTADNIILIVFALVIFDTIILIIANKRKILNN